MKLTLFFTEGVSLQTWSEVGMLDRELALYKALQKRDVEVSFVTYGDARDLQFASRLPGIAIQVNSSGIPISRYEQALQSSPPAGDVFKSNQIAGAQVALAAARRANVKFLARCGYLLSEFQEQRYGGRSAEGKAARQLEKEVFLGADAVVVTTDAMAASIKERYSIPAEIISVIPNYVETERFTPLPRQPNQKPRIVFVGRLDKQKNLAAFVQAIAEMDAEVWLIGYGQQREYLEKKTQTAKATFRFLGNVPNAELPGFLNSCDLFVLPSLYEGHPKALLEAMACGLGVVGTRVAGTREIIRDGENGLLCETDAKSIKVAVECLLNDPVLRERLGKAATLFVKEHFALERVVGLEMKLLNELMAA
jgi:glycosyltransferase involved in cell wall biosynthesis